MAVKVIERLSISVVLVGDGLLSSDAEIKAFGDRFSQEVHHEVIQNIGTGTLASRVSIRREHITIELLPGQSTISKEYPDDDDWQTFVEAASRAISESKNLSVNARGYNFNLVADQRVKPTAYEYIITQVATPLLIPGWRPTGGSTQLRFMDEEDRRWSVKIEPRLGDEDTSKLFLHFHLHLPGSPESNEVVRYVELMRSRAGVFLEQLP